ncbi:MAG: SusF/SusE family outer membrane protein [Bacteroidaceae bacterium]|nr:SusF/SusE family outer membrane protein [Bacteroidaceae bacterium]
MKKLFTFLFAFACFAGLSAREVYLVGDATPAGWSTDAENLAKTTMTEVSADVFEWTGVLTKTVSPSGEGFKLITQKGWNPAIHPSTPGLVLNEVGSDVVKHAYSGDPDTKWTISETAEYLLRVTFRSDDVVVVLQKVGEVGVGLPQVDGVYQLSTAEHLATFAAKFNDGSIEGDCKAVMTQDIDLSSIDAWTAIGTDGKKFMGTFDGQGYRIKGMKINGSLKEQGFFGVAGAGAVIKNLIIDSSCNLVSTGGACIAAFVGCCNNNGTITFENCGNEANVVGKAQNNAAFLGCNYGGTKLVFNNCYNTGKISGGWENGAFSGWTGGGATFNNCYNIGEVTEGETWARGSKSMNNCYQTVGADQGVTQIDAAAVGTGELCYKLNGEQTTISYYQTIGTDNYPVPFSSSLRVYANGQLKCDGTSAGGELTYSNTNESVIPDHIYANGWCSVCGKFDQNYLTADGEGFYNIGTANDLKWFAKYVTEVSSTANAKLTANIDYTENKKDFIGATRDVPFRGVFDGQGNSITIALESNNTGRTALFAYIVNATIKNLIVEGSVTSAGENCVGGLAGRSEGDNTLIENVVVKTAVSYTGTNGDATCGGLFSDVEHKATIKNCAFIGSIKTGTAEGNGGLVGYAHSGVNQKYINCLVAPTEYTKNGNSGEFSRNNPTVINSYYVASDDARLATGELCYKLNADGDNWFQNIGSDSYPMPFNTYAKVLYVGEDGYATMYDTTSGYELNGDAKAYVATLNKTWLDLTEVEGVPVATPVVLKGTYYNKVAANLPAISVPNDLKGTDTDIEADGTMYVLAKLDGKAGFYKAEGTIAAGKAYYQSTSGVKAFYFEGGDATGISDVNVSLNEDNAIYNIAGQRLQKMQKGINIVNGKKVLF